MALIFLLMLCVLVWAIGVLQLSPRFQRLGSAALWLGGAFAVSVAACVAWGFVGVFRHSDWQALSNGQAMRSMFGAGTSWFQRTGLGPLDRAANAYLSMDLVWTLMALCAAAMHGYVSWAGVAERRRQARVRASR